MNKINVCKRVNYKFVFRSPDVNTKYTSLSGSLSKICSNLALSEHPSIRITVNCALLKIFKNKDNRLSRSLISVESNSMF